MYFNALRACLALAAGLALLHGCSIREDRTQCPRYVTVDLSEVRAQELMDEGYETLHLGLVPATDAGLMSAGRTSLPLESLPREVEFETSREELRLWGICCDALDYSGEGEIIIPKGSACPSFYGFRAIVAESGDTVVPMQLHKDFCNVSIRFREGYSRSCGYSISGTVCGCDGEGNPIDGEFEHNLEPDADGNCSVCIPRQKDGSLRLRISGGEEVLRVFAIGEYILQSGYDWTAADLEDISVTVSFVSSTATFSIDMWQKSIIIDVEL